MKRFIKKDEPEANVLDEKATNEKYEEFGLMNLYENHAQFAFEFRKGNKAVEIPADMGSL